MCSERLSDAEEEFLILGYNRFFNIFKEVMSNNFWEKDDYYRLSVIREAFMIYTELGNYKGLKEVAESLGFIGDFHDDPFQDGGFVCNFFKVMRNILTHFPLFTSWDSIWIRSDIINWDREQARIDKFLKENSGKRLVNFKVGSDNFCTEIEIKIPKKYKNNEKVFLNEIISEKDGIKFSLILMKQILDIHNQTLKL